MNVHPAPLGCMGAGKCHLRLGSHPQDQPCTVEEDSEAVVNGHLCPSAVAIDDSCHFHLLSETPGLYVLFLGLWLIRCLGQEGTEEGAITQERAHSTAPHTWLGGEKFWLF